MNYLEGEISGFTGLPEALEKNEVNLLSYSCIQRSMSSTGEALGRALAHLKRGREGTFSSVNRQKLHQSANQYRFPENSSAGKKITADSTAHRSFLVAKIHAFLSIANIPVTITCLGVVRLGMLLVLSFLLKFICIISLQLRPSPGSRFVSICRLHVWTLRLRQVYGPGFLGFWAKIERRKVYGLSSGHMAHKSRAGIQTQFAITGTVPFDVVMIKQMWALTWN